MRKVIRYMLEKLSYGVLAIIPPLNQGTRITQTQPCSSTANGTVDYVNCTFSRITDNGLNVFYAVIAGLALVLMVWAGIQYIQALGSGERVKAARQRIINIFIAIVILVAAYAVLNFLVDLIGYLASKVPG